MTRASIKAYYPESPLVYRETGPWENRWRRVRDSNSQAFRAAVFKTADLPVSLTLRKGEITYLRFHRQVDSTGPAEMTGR
jgi:hypothetical protein